VNRRTYLPLALVFSGAFLLPGGLGAAEIIPDDNVFVPAPRTAAMGGLHAAQADDTTSLFSNPAAFRSVEPEFKAAELAFGVSGPVFTVSSIVLEGMSSDIDDVLTSPEVNNLLQSLYAGFSLVGPLSFAYVGEGLGFGVTASNGVVAEGTGASVLDFNIYQRLLISGGYAARIPTPGNMPGELDAGFLFKGFVTGRSGFSTGILDLPDTLGSIGPGTVLDEPFDLITGVGIDVGTRYAPNQIWAFGLTVQNLLAPAVINQYSSLRAFLENEQPVARPAGRIPQNVSFGVEYAPPLSSGFGRHVSDWRIYFDYRDIIDFWAAPETSENILLKFSLGSEFTMLQVLSIRLGFARGLPAAGFGLDLTRFTFSAAMFGTELTTEPGFKSVYNLLIGVTFTL
jgi:hypothetical protein